VIRLSLIGVRVEVPTNQPIVLLREDDGTRFLPIFIGQPEATAIVYALQGEETPRPMTHDLFKSVLDDLAVKLARVEITALRASRRGRPMQSRSPSASARRRSTRTRRCSTRPASCSRRTRKSRKSSSSANSSTTSRPRTSPPSRSGEASRPPRTCGSTCGKGSGLRFDPDVTTLVSPVGSSPGLRQG